jgi:prolyl-tRNA synthetase
MKDSYSLDTDWQGLETQYQAHYQAYFNIFHRCGLEAVAVKSDTGMMGGRLAHEFMYLTPIGEDTILICSGCDYAANRQIANFKKTSSTEEEPLPLEKVATPECRTITDLAAFLEIPESRTAKAVFMIARVPVISKDVARLDPSAVEQKEESEFLERFVLAIVRGDMEVNETKLINAIQASEIRPATEDEIRAVGAEPGYASPVGLEDVFVVVDDIIPESPNLVAGANLAGYHLINVNYSRDYQAQIVGDIAAAQDGDSCPVCEGRLQAVRGVEVGNIFQLGTKYSQDLGATYQDRDGNSHPVVMGSYGIGSGRLLACIAEEYNDDNGLVWPISVAPYQVHLIVLTGRTRTAYGSAREDSLADLTRKPSGLPGESLAENLYQDLREAGIEVLYDDRPATPGVKFKDADLIGIPIRVTVSQRALDQGGVEYKRRDQQAKRIIPAENLISVITGEISELHSKINRMVTPIAYPR